MSNRLILNKQQGFLPCVLAALISLTVLLSGLVTLTGCRSNLADTELPQDFIRDYIAKHETMVDKSLVYYYALEEQDAIAEKIDTICRINDSKGLLAELQNATFDFSGLQIELIDIKEEYVDDEPVVFCKVAVRGRYRMRLSEETRTIEADDLIILRLARHQWKVTEKHNPWS